MKENGLELFLGKAKELEKKYDWLGAVESYRKASDLSLKATLQVAMLREKMGYCFIRAAFQAGTNKQFTSRMNLAVGAFEEAAMLLETVQEKGIRSKIEHAKAMIAYTSFWLATDPSKMKELLDEWRKLEKEALKACEEAGDRQGIGIICTNLAEGHLGLAYSVLSDWPLLEKRIEEGIGYGEKAIEALSEVGDEWALASAYLWTSFNCTIAVWYRVLEDRREEYGQKSIKYSRKALLLSRRTKDAYLIAHSNLTSGLREWGYSLNPISAIKFFKNALKYGMTAKDSLIISMACVWIVFNRNHVLNLEEDPDKQREGFEKSLKFAQKGIQYARVFAGYPYVNFACCTYVWTNYYCALIETNLKAKRIILENAVALGRESIKDAEPWMRTHPSFFIHEALSVFTNVLYRLCELETRVGEKRILLEEASKFAEILENISQRLAPLAYWNIAGAENTRALIQAALAEIEPNFEKKRQLLESAVLFMEHCSELVAQDLRGITPGWKIHFIGPYYYWFGGILEQLYLLTRNKEVLDRAIKAYTDAAEGYNKAELKTREAESYWQKARLHDLLGNYLEASLNYESASKTYKISGEKIPQLRDFYEEHSLYMQAWSKTEQARHFHSIEDYAKAKENYEKSAELHEKSRSWSYLAPNYSAWANMEEAEGLSRTENSQNAKEAFQKALKQFIHAEESFKQRMGEITSTAEKEMAQRLFEASDLRRKYCQARILMEDARLLDREGKYLQSSRSYGAAAKEIGSIFGKMDVEAERNELRYLVILCQAWEKMAVAEETSSAESYLEAAALFEQAKQLCYTRKASLWALGNSSFCRGLAAGVNYQTTLDLKEHGKAKSYIKSAATNYLQAGFRNASEYAKATQRLFDAYLYINKAESESDQEVRAKHYQMVENLLQIAAGSFTKAKQPEKTAKVQEILASVREEKALAVSLSQVMHAPSIASTTQTFTAPAPTREVSVGMESFEHANVQANLITELKEVKVGESFCLSVEFVNAGREPALLIRVEDFIPLDFDVVEKPDIYRLEESCLNMKGKQIAPLKLVEAKVVLQPSKKGLYLLSPRVHYLDELGQNRMLQLKSLEIRVEEVVLSDRVSTGTKELDSLLLGGIPKEYAVVLTGSPSDERELIVRNFLEAGAEEGQASFHVAAEADGLEGLLEMPGFSLFLCNPRPKIWVPDLPNVYRLLGKTDLTNLGIALLKAYRNVEASLRKRICLGIVSDVLLRYGAEATRRWISELITDLVSKGFTILAVMNSGMHPLDQVAAVVDLFDGEIGIAQTDDPLKSEKSIRIKKLKNQDYIKNPIYLTKSPT